MGIKILFSIVIAFAEEVTFTAYSQNPVQEYQLTQEEKSMDLFLYVDKAATAQFIKVYEKGNLVSTYVVSTGREVAESNYKNPNFETYCSSTPTGVFRPLGMHDLYLSEQWGGSKMYNTTFIQNGYAFHGVDQHYYKDLGRRASGGCIRMTQEDSKVVYDKIKIVNSKRGKMRIRIDDSSPESEKINIAEDCANQMLVVKCAQEKLRKEQYYKKNLPVAKTVSGRTFKTYNIPFDYAYQKEVECQSELAAKGAFSLAPRRSPRPYRRPNPLPKVYLTDPPGDAFF